ncbi:MAG TPA: hypothetical protein ENH39_04440 [Gammaproteobacteria bacterium]|nr:hypothetical protein [Gammaproteobacteria bacterium]
MKLPIRHIIIFLYPWHFEIIDEIRFLIHTDGTQNWCVYDLDGMACQTALGALPGIFAIATSGKRMNAVFCI